MLGVDVHKNELQNYTICEVISYIAAYRFLSNVRDELVIVTMGSIFDYPKKGLQFGKLTCS
jgi:hypothetical protein